MIEYTADGISDLQTDAVVVDVNCLGVFAPPVLQAIRATYPENIKAFEDAFECGEVEPGNLSMVDRGNQKPRYVFNLPTKIHPNGATKREFIDEGVSNLVDCVLKFGIKSIAIPCLHNQRGLTWPQVKLRILSKFARIPEIRTVFYNPPDTEVKPKQVVVYTDGGAVPNPGTGGFGVVLVFGDIRKELSEGFELTSNNRMELMAAIAGLEALQERCAVRLISDSRYVVDAVNNGFLFRLQARNWKSQKAKNVDLLKRFLDAYLQHEVEMVWVKGHAGIADNERCDKLARQSIAGAQFSIDQGYLDQLKHRKRAKQSNSTAAKRPGSAHPRGPKPKQAGDACRHCATPVVRRNPKKNNPSSKYYFAWYLYCENCHRLYHVEEAKVYRSVDGG